MDFGDRILPLFTKILKQKPEIVNFYVASNSTSTVAVPNVHQKYS